MGVLAYKQKQLVNISYFSFSLFFSPGFEIPHGIGNIFCREHTSLEICMYVIDTLSADVYL